MQALQDAGVDVGRLGNGAEELTIEGGRTRAPTPTPAPTRAKPVPEKGEIGRGEQVLARRLAAAAALPWPGVPHCNAWALRADDGIVLVDTGYAGEDGTRQLEYAMAQVGLELAGARLLVCTHAAPTITAWRGRSWTPPDASSGCIRLGARPGTRGGPRRGGSTGGSRWRGRAACRPASSATGRPAGGRAPASRTVPPDRELVPGVEVETDVGTWQVHETPGHAPSHVVLHQPESGLLLSGDHLLGRVSLFFDHGHTPDPVGEFLVSLDRVEKLETTLCLAGHGRPFATCRPRSAPTGRRWTSISTGCAAPSTASRAPPSRSSLS